MNWLQIVLAVAMGATCGLLYLIYRALGVISWHLHELRKDFRHNAEKRG